MKNFKFMRSAFSMLMISILVFTMCSINVSAATTLQNVAFIADGSKGEMDAIVTDHSSGLDQANNRRFCDGNNTIVYKMPLIPDATKANLLLTLSGNYTIQISTDNATWIQAAAQTPVGGKKVIAIDLMPYIHSPYIYFRMGDQTTNDGGGGILYQAAVYYADYTTVDYSPYTTKDEFYFQANTDFERRFISADNGSSPKDGQYMRFTDANSTITYKLPYDRSKTAYLKALIGANYMIWISSDATNWKLIAKDPSNGGTVVGVPSQTKMLVYDLKDYKGKAIDYIYLKMGDQTTNDGWGGNIYEISMAYDTQKLYNMFDLTGVVYPAPVVSTPVVSSKASSTAVASSKASSTSTKASSTAKASSVKSTTAANSTTSVASGSSSDITSSEVSSSEISSDVSSEVASSQITSSATDSATTTTTPSGSNTIFYVLIIIAGVILLGGAVVQYIFMEKRKI